MRVTITKFPRLIALLGVMVVMLPVILISQNQQQNLSSHAATTMLSFTVFLHGIGKGGDSANALSGGNPNPIRTQRILSVGIFNAQNVLVTSKSIPATYNSTTGNFTGTGDFGTLASGPYTVTIRADMYLQQVAAGIQTITSGQTKQIPPVYLISGDIDTNNQINIADYNSLMGCYSDLTAAKSCTSQQKTAADLTDDGSVNQLDYNLFIREIGNRSGAGNPTIGPTLAQPTVSPTIPIQVLRDPLKQPFASNSIWNMPIGTGAVYVAANLPANPGSDNWTPMPQIDDEHIVLKPTAPLTTINYSSAGWSGTSRCNATGNGSGGGLPVSVPIPANYLVPNDNTNSGSAFLLADGRTIVQSQPFTRCTAGGSATGIIKFANVDLYGDGILGAHGGSRLSAIGGSIRVGELRPGQQGPKHALKLNVDAPRALYKCTTAANCFRWPAATADSGAVGDYGTATNNQNTAMKMGALLAIPASVNITAMGLESDPGKQLAWTLQNYGMYIVDATGGPAYALSAENGPDGSKRTEFQSDYGYALEQRINDNTAWSRDVQRLMTALSVVNNNSATSIGGGGTPRQPLAPAIVP
jgi:hypothetical protein